MEPLMIYFCKSEPNEEEIRSSCNIANQKKGPVCLFFEREGDLQYNLQSVVIHPGEEVADIQEKLKCKSFMSFVKHYC